MRGVARRGTRQSLMQNNTLTTANQMIDRWLRQFIFGQPNLAYAVCGAGMQPKISNEYFLEHFTDTSVQSARTTLVEFVPELGSNEADLLDVLAGRKPVTVHSELIHRSIGEKDVQFQAYVQHMPGAGEACLFVALPVHGTTDREGFSRQLMNSFEQSVGDMTEADKQLLSSIILDQEAREFQEGALEENRARMAAILNAVSDGIIGVDHDASIRTVNPSVLAQWAYQRQDLIGKSISVLFEEGSGMERIPELLELEKGSLPQDIVRRIRTVAVRSDGSEFPVEVAINRVDHPGSVAFVAVARNISEQEKNEQRMQEYSEDLRHSKERLTELSKRLVIAQEEERRKIALDLHDDLGSRIAMIDMGLSRIRHQVGDQEIEGMEALEAQVLEITNILRRIAYSLRPKILDDYGLLEAYDWLVSSFEEESGIRVDFTWSGIGRDDRFDKMLELAAFRVVQESLTNIAKHANVTECALRLTVLEKLLLLSIYDEGIGFDVKKNMEESNTIGLLGMEERVKQLGGVIQIQSVEGEGSQILVEFPIDQENQDVGVT